MNNIYIIWYLYNRDVLVYIVIWQNIVTPLKLPNAHLFFYISCIKFWSTNTYLTHTHILLISRTDHWYLLWYKPGTNLYTISWSVWSDLIFSRGLVLCTCTSHIGQYLLLSRYFTIQLRQTKTVKCTCQIQGDNCVVFIKLTWVQAFNDSSGIN